jgi:hypothetical protein
VCATFVGVAWLITQYPPSPSSLWNQVSDPLQEFVPLSCVRR